MLVYRSAIGEYHELMLHLSNESFERYCGYFGYDYYWTTQPAKGAEQYASPAWNKLLLAAELLRKEKVICWVDSDVLVNIPAKGALKNLFELPMSFSMLFEMNHYTPHYNTGVMILTRKELPLIEATLERGDLDSDHPLFSWYEQYPFNLTMNEKNIKPVGLGLNYNYSVSVHGEAPKKSNVLFLAYHGIQPIKERYLMMKADAERLGYKESLTEVVAAKIVAEEVVANATEGN